MKNKKGITLIALVIIVVILLILAGIALTALSKDNNVIANAKKAKKNQKLVVGNEESKLLEYSDDIEDEISEKIKEIDIVGTKYYSIPELSDDGVTWTFDNNDTGTLSYRKNSYSCSYTYNPSTKTGTIDASDVQELGSTISFKNLENGYIIYIEEARTTLVNLEANIIDSSNLIGNSYGNGMMKFVESDGEKYVKIDGDLYSFIIIGNNIYIDGLGFSEFSASESSVVVNQTTYAKDLKVDRYGEEDGYFQLTDEHTVELFIKDGNKLVLCGKWTGTWYGPDTLENNCMNYFGSKPSNICVDESDGEDAETTKYYSFIGKCIKSMFGGEPDEEECMCFRMDEDKMVMELESTPWRPGWSRSVLEGGGDFPKID